MAYVYEDIRHIQSLDDFCSLSPWIEPSLEILRMHMIPDAGHDEGHLLRVTKTALTLEDNLDLDVLLPACILHDLHNAPKYNLATREQASRLSANLACEFLNDKFPFIDDDHEQAVFHAILAHSYSAGVTPTTPEACALQDADRLESLGYIGLARLFAVGGSTNRTLFHPIDPLAEHRDLDESRYSLDHFSVKLAKLPSLMRTPKGRALADARMITMKIFIFGLIQEMQLQSSSDDPDRDNWNRVLKFSGMELANKGLEP